MAVEDYSRNGLIYHFQNEGAQKDHGEDQPGQQEIHQ